MTQNDAWFVGLLALAYLYLDSTPAPRQMSDNEFIPGPVPTDEPVDFSRLLPVHVADRDVCPRNHLHPVAVRADGAMWCRGCDEAFYPEVVLWESLTQVVAA